MELAAHAKELKCLNWALYWILLKPLKSSSFIHFPLLPLLVCGFYAKICRSTFYQKNRRVERKSLLFFSLSTPQRWSLGNLREIYGIEWKCVLGWSGILESIFVLSQHFPSNGVNFHFSTFHNRTQFWEKFWNFCLKQRILILFEEIRNCIREFKYN